MAFPSGSQWAIQKAIEALEKALATRGAPDGIAQLGPDGRVRPEQLPPGNQDVADLADRIAALEQSTYPNG